MPFVPDLLKPRLRNAVLHSALCAALCAALGASFVMPVPARAAVLGEAKVRSFLGQKLDAEIEISSLTATESEALLVRIPAADAFAAAGIDMTALVRSLRVTIEKRGEQTFVRLNSDQSIAEPFLMVLVELNAGGTRTLRQYALLIDPAPVDRSQQAGNVEPAIAEPQAQDAKGATPADARASSAVGNAAGTPGAAATTSSAANATTSQARLIATTSRRVRKGDTLAGIGNEVKPEGIRLEQVLVALQRANPQAFEGNNINRMKSGSVLSVPSADSMRDIDATAARRIVIAQSADFQRYREALAERMNIAAANSANSVPAANDGSAAGAGNRSSSGTVGVTVKEPGARPESQDQLKLTAPGQSGGNAAGKTATNANGANDRKTLDQIAADKALADANSRIAALEKNLTQMEQMLEVRDRKLADAQKSAELAAQDARDAKGASDTARRDAAPANPPIATGAPSAPAAAEPAATLSTLATPAATSTDPAAPAAKEGKPAPAAKSPAPAPAVSAPASWNDYLNDPIARAIAAGAALLALAGLLLRARRARGDQQGRRGKRSKVNLVGSAGATSSASAAAAEAANAANAADAAAVRAHATAEPGTTPIAPVIAAINPDQQAEAKVGGKAAASDVDAIAEADVYIAYGRTEQAEEILRDALREQPQRHALRVKLLEIYASRRDRKAFGELATELCAFTGGKGSAWEQAAQMGQMLDPGNPLYGSMPQAMHTVAQRNPPASLQAVPAAGKDGGRAAAGSSATSSAGSSVDDFGLKLEGLLDEQRREQGKPPAPMQAAAASATPDFSLSGISRGEASGRRIEPTLSGEPDHAALTTKLDLAQACEEIGDHEGARELLAEVAAAHDPELSRRAQDLLRKLA